jgi:hypothetical protein
MTCRLTPNIDINQYKAFSHGVESDFDQTLDYFKARIHLEHEYSKGLDKLNKRFPAPPNDFFAELIQFTGAVSAMHSLMFDQLEDIIRAMTTFKQSAAKHSNETRSKVKTAFKHHCDLLANSVAKSKQVYQKKLAIDNTDVQKQLKINKEQSDAELMYRLSIQHLEESRQSLEKLRRVTKKVLWF